LSLAIHLRLLSVVAPAAHSACAGPGRGCTGAQVCLRSGSLQRESQVRLDENVSDHGRRARHSDHSNAEPTAEPPCNITTKLWTAGTNSATVSAHTARLIVGETSRSHQPVASVIAVTTAIQKHRECMCPPGRLKGSFFEQECAIMNRLKFWNSLACRVPKWEPVFGAGVCFPDTM
jgi:hypothetical protein